MNYFKHQGSLLLVNGYRIVKIAGRGKNPIENGWTTKIITKEDCENDNAADRSVGIICGEDVICVDADINKDNVASRIKEFIRRQYPDCIIPTRYGKRPKFAMLFRNTHNLPPSRTQIYEKLEGDERVTAQIEFRGKNQQFVAYGIHPATGKEYEWENGSPEFLSVEDLPTLTPEIKDAIEQKLDELVKAEGFSAEHPAESGKALERAKLEEEDIALFNFSDHLGMSLEDAEEALKDCVLSVDDYTSWITVGQALHFEFNGAYSACDLWDKWSSKSPKYEAGKTREKWDTFSSNRANLVTMGTVLKNCPNFRLSEIVATDEGAMTIIVMRRLKGLVRYIKAQNRWAHFDGCHWCIGTESGSAALVRRVVERVLKEQLEKYKGGTSLGKAVRGYNKQYISNKANRIQRLFDNFKLYDEMHLDAGVIDSNNRYFGVGNGDIDLVTGELLPPSPEHYIGRHTRIHCIKDAQCPRWKQTLKECLVHDSVIEYFQKLVGQAALGQPNHGHLTFLYGGGCNGKSTILEVLREVFGDYHRTASPEVFILSNRSGGNLRTDLIDLKGARIIELPETGQGGRLDVHQMKRITGGDQLSARVPYAVEQERFSLVGVPFIATNYRPDIRESDDGTWRRISSINFPRNFEKDPNIKKDEHLREKLALEYEGILNWVIEGALKVQKEGLEKPQEVKSDVEEYRRENDLVGQFVEECLVFDEKGYITGATLTNRWKTFCEEKGDNGGINKQSKLLDALMRRYGLKKTAPKNRPRLNGIRDKKDEELMDSGDED
mgnify:FL=1|nr:MAG TPA: dsDNA helicase [Caudoviricetes sp.]